MPMIEDHPVPTRATYFNMYKWPESDVKFLKSIISGDGGEGQARAGPDGLACRELYLRSYTFSREGDNCKNINCHRLLTKRRKKSFCGGGGGGRSAMESLCRRMLSCTFKIHVQE